MINDIRAVKRDLRQKYRNIRTGMSAAEKKAADNEIFARLTSFAEYKKARTILCFVSTDIEVDTVNIINAALSDGKAVAVPKCLDKQGKMDFFLIHSLDDLEKGEFGLLEPDPARFEKLSDYRNSLCILPGFAFDRQGFRIGFGKGYYDRFLKDYTGVTAGICYNTCIAAALPHGRYDKPADYIVTCKYILTVKEQQSTKKG